MTWSRSRAALIGDQARSPDLKSPGNVVTRSLRRLPPAKQLRPMQ